MEKLRGFAAGDGLTPCKSVDGLVSASFMKRRRQKLFTIPVYTCAVLLLAGRSPLSGRMREESSGFFNLSLLYLPMC